MKETKLFNLTKDKKMEQTINIEKSADGVLVVREGEALPLREPVAVNLTGTIETVYLWLEKKVSCINQLNSYITVDRDELKMQLIIEEHDYYSDEITAKLQFSRQFNQLRINSNSKWTTFELASFFRMNRKMFKTKEDALEITASLKKFEAKVQQDIEKIKDDRANYSTKKIQAVETNIPKAISITLPIFKGQDPETIEIEFDIDPNELSISLVSPQAADIVQIVTNEAIDKEIEKIQGIASNIVIIEV
jgi:hypothetical protein